MSFQCSGIGRVLSATHAHPQRQRRQDTRQGGRRRRTDGLAVDLQPITSLVQRRDRQRVKLSVAVRPVADLEEATLRDDVDEIPDDEAAVHVVARVRVVGHKVRPVVNDLPVAGDGLVRELLLRPEFRVQQLL